MRLRAATSRPNIAHKKALRAFPPPILQFRFMQPFYFTIRSLVRRVDKPNQAAFISG